MEKIDARKLPPEALECIRRQTFVLHRQGYSLLPYARTRFRMRSARWSCEYLNRDLKTSIRTVLLSRPAALFEKVRTCMEIIAAIPERVRSYFSHEYVRYAQ